MALNTDEEGESITFIQRSSMSSIRATGMLRAMTSMTASTAPCSNQAMWPKEHRAERMAETQNGTSRGIAVAAEQRGLGESEQQPRRLRKSHHRRGEGGADRGSA